MRDVRREIQNMRGGMCEWTWKGWNMESTLLRVRRTKNLRSTWILDFWSSKSDRRNNIPSPRSFETPRKVYLVLYDSLIDVTSKRSRTGQSETRTRKCDSAVRSSVEVAASHPDRILFVVVFHGPAPIQGYRLSFRPYISLLFLSLSFFYPCPSRSGVVYQLQHAPAHPGDQYRPMSISRGRLFRMSLGEREREKVGKKGPDWYAYSDSPDSHTVRNNTISKCLFIYLLQ